jgi:hypothetical protein
MRVSVLQALDWPRAWVPIPDSPSGYRQGSAYVSQTIVPTEVKAACSELALISGSQVLMPNLERAQSEVKIGEINIKYDVFSSELPRYKFIDAILKMYLSGGSMAQLVRT